MKFWSKKEKVEGVKFEPLQDGWGFKLDIEGQKAVAVKLDGKSAREFTDQAKAAINPVGGVAGAGVGYRSESEVSWMVFTNIQNPMLREGLDRFLLLASQTLTNASHSQVPISSLIVSGTTTLIPTCSHCGVSLPSNHVGSCPNCGKEGRSFNLKLGEGVNLSG